MTEEWRVIPGFIEHEVSDLGRIRRTTDHSARWLSGHILAPWKSKKTGHLLIEIKEGRNSIKTHVAVLVLHCFKGAPPSPEHEAAHWDGDPGNNTLDNLRWATRTENQHDRLRHGTSNRGERHGGSKLTAAHVMAIKDQLRAGRNRQKIATDHGVSFWTVHSIAYGRSWAWLD